MGYLPDLLLRAFSDYHRGRRGEGRQLGVLITETCSPIFTPSLTSLSSLSWSLWIPSYLYVIVYPAFLCVMAALPHTLATRRHCLITFHVISLSISGSSHCRVGSIFRIGLSIVSAILWYPCGHYNYNFDLGLDSVLARSRNCLRKILPAALFGTWSMMTTPPLRNFCFETRPRTHSCISLENAVDSTPGCGFALGTTYALEEDIG